MNVYMIPYREEDFPRSGGVRTHLIQLKRWLPTVEGVELLPYRAAPIAHLQHVEATYTPMPNLPLVYVTHGGFLPQPSPIVIRNLRRADFIISVADWLVERFFKPLAYKTAVIPNGVDLAEFDDLPPSGLEPGYVLYGKDWGYFLEDFMQLVQAMPHQRFVTVFWPDGMAIPPNVHYVGTQSPAKMKAIIKDAGMLLITGSEVCPIMLLEAWAARTPVLARAIDGNVELMRPFWPDSEDVIGGVLYMTPRNAVKAIPYILNERDRLGEEGRERVEALYQWKDLVGRYKTVYESVVKA